LYSAAGSAAARLEDVAFAVVAHSVEIDAADLHAHGNLLHGNAVTIQPSSPS
jgi:hypothetical protein